MLLNRRILALIILILCSKISFSQMEGYNWYFGTYAAISFNSGIPKALGNSNMNAGYGCASISSPDGKMLFYTDGSKIYDSTHTIMPNGNKLMGSQYFSTQSAIIVPWPDSVHLFYLFTPSLPGKDTMAYSIVNMKLNSGRGDIIATKKNLKLPFISSGKITAIRHVNRKGFWVVIPKSNSDTIFSYLLTPTGIYSPIISKTGFKLNQKNGLDSTRGYLKLSPDGKKICNMNLLDSCYIADFDASNGRISNVWGFKLYWSGIGVEFSQKSKFLYIADNGNRLSQFNLSFKNKSDFLSSRITVDTISKAVLIYSGFQLGPDGKIYFAEAYGSYLHILHAPDSLGNKARFRINSLTLWPSTKSLSGLPDFIQSYFHKPSITITQNCARDTAFFHLNDTYLFDSAHWDFGDLTSGKILHSLKTPNVFYSYSSPGRYKIKVISFNKQFIDTIYEIIDVNYPKPFLGNDKILCNQFKHSLNPAGSFKSYKWNTGSATKSITVSKGGTYILSVSDFDGCLSADTIVIFNPSVQAKFNLSDTASCVKGNQIQLADVSDYKNDLRKLRTWYFSDGTVAADSFIQKSFKANGVFTVKLVALGQLGCRDSISKQVHILSNTQVDFELGDSVQCLNTNTFNFNNRSVNFSDTITFDWDLGESKSNLRHITGKRYLQLGTYRITLISTTSKNCKDTLSKTISVLENPIPDFSWNSSCNKYPIQFNFTGSVPPQPISTLYTWYFPDKDTSLLKNPTKQLNQAGLNSVILKLVSTNGCAASITKEIEVLNQAQANFEVKDGCEDSLVRFINTTNAGNSFIWMFGDGNTSKLYSPNHRFIINGITKTFNVKLLANVANGCSDSVTKAVTVNAKPKTGFTYSKSGQSVNFTANESNAVNYKWNFGDGGIANSNNAKQSYSYSKFPSGNYTACLRTTNLAGCFSDTCIEILITGSVNDLKLTKGIHLYPNPNSGEFVLEIKHPTMLTSFEIYNQVGQVIFNSLLDKSINKFDLKLDNGFYLVKVSQGEHVYYQKVIIEQ